MDRVPDEGQTLLGRRFLCRHGGLLLIGPSGIGKSSAIAQACTLWAIGRKAFGIKPARPLRILMIQAEDDEGDNIEIANGIGGHLGLDLDEIMLCRNNFMVVGARHHAGILFFTELFDPLMEAQKPIDLVVVNPFQAYLGGDIKDPAITSAFLRNQFNPRLERFNCGGLVVHHTPKTTFQNRETWKASQWMYAGAGAADITNWARAIVVIDPTDNDEHVFRFIAAKRGTRIGWERHGTNGEGIVKYFKHSGSREIFWEEAEESEIPASKKQSRDQQGRVQAKYSAQMVLTLMSMVTGSRTDDMRKLCCHETGMSKSKFYEFWDQLKNERKITLMNPKDPKDHRWIPT
jgi:AAA domain